MTDYNNLFEADKQRILDKIKNDPNWQIREAIVKKLTNEKLILNFKDDSHWLVRKAVINKLSDESQIFNTFKDDPHWRVQAEVQLKLKNNFKKIYKNYWQVILYSI